MKLRSFLFLAATSSMLLALPARTARRPRYGGTLRLEMGAAVYSLDPASATSEPEVAFAKSRLDTLIYSRGQDGSFAVGTRQGPFRLAEWQPGKQLTLVANDDYPTGRPFVDQIEIQMARPAKDRLLDLELGKADLAEIPVEEARRAAERGLRLSSSPLDELVVLVFLPGRPLAEDPQVREAVAQATDRASIANFILQKEGEPAGGLLPQWSSGTEFLFSTAADPSAAKEQWSRMPGSAKILLGYDANDTLEQAIAERLAVNAHEAGMAMATIPMTSAPASFARADARLIRLHMSSSRPSVALSGFLSALAPFTDIQSGALPDSASPEQIYHLERSIVSSYRVIPLVWLPQVYGLSSRLRDWKVPGPGEDWPLADVWLDQPGVAGPK